MGIEDDALRKILRQQLTCIYIYIYMCIYVPGTLNNHFFKGCFNWMIPNLYMGNGCFTKHPL